MTKLVAAAYKTAPTLTRLAGMGAAWMQPEAAPLALGVGESGA
jgi:hypothetical protein